MNQKTTKGFHGKADNARHNNTVNKSIDAFVKSGALEVITNARACFNVNKVSYKDIDRFDRAIQELDSTHRLNNRESPSWITYERKESSLYGATPKDTFDAKIAPIVELYNEINPDNAFGTYGTANVKVDFSQFVPTELQTYPFGLIFIGDSKNRSDAAVGNLSTIERPFFTKVGANQTHKYTYLRTIRDLTDVTLSCVFRRRGTLIIFGVTNEVEKQADQYWPVLKIVTIPLRTVRNYDDNSQALEHVVADIDNATSSEICVSDVTFSVLQSVLTVSRMNPAIGGFFPKQLAKALGSDVENYLDMIESMINSWHGRRNYNTTQQQAEVSDGSADAVESESQSEEANDGSTSEETSGQEESGEEADYEEVDESREEDSGEEGGEQEPGQEGDDK